MEEKNMENNNAYIIPTPILNAKEENSIDELTKRYDKLCEPGAISVAKERLVKFIPDKVKKLSNNAKNLITEQQLYTQAMDVILKGFKAVEEQASKFSISENGIIDNINSVCKDNQISKIEEILLMRGYDISKAVNRYKTKDFWTAFAEGAITGAGGFWTLPFNIVLSTFLYYRAVQSIAMHYGYDVKNDSAELMIASEVFINALSPDSDSHSEMANLIGKIMLIGKAEAVKQTVKKGWTEMAAKGGTELFLTQIRALAHKSAQKALENAGKKGIENSIFKDIFAQVGRKLTQKVIARSIPVVSGIIGALFDSAQMQQVLDYADVFYNKRFLLEKEQRINMLVEGKECIFDVEYEESACDDEEDMN
ncbi:MAG TPA: EcsC protein [Clostridium sp.]|nr:EcsC protein [Clostridium sp.]